MAPFNPEVSKTPSSNFINASQGSAPNRALGTLFETIGDVAKTFKVNSERSERDAEKELDKAFNRDLATGVDAIGQPIIEAGTLFNKESADNTPQGIRDAGKRLQRYNTALEQGSNPQAILLKKNALIKQLRAKYPDKGLEVDRLVEAYFDVTPANQLLKLAQNEAEAEQKTRTAEENSRMAFAQQYMSYLGDEDFQTGYKSVTGEDFNLSTFDRGAAIAVMAPHMAAKRKDEEANLRMERLDAQNARDRKEGKDIIFAQGSQLKERLLYTALNKMNDRIGGDELSIKFAKASGIVERGVTTPLSPEDKKAAAMLLTELRMKLSQHADAFLSQSWDGKTTANNFLSVDEKKAFKEQLTEPINILERALAGDKADLSIVANMKDYYDGIRADPNSNYARDAEMEKRWQSMEKLVGSDRMSTIISATQNDASYQAMNEKDKAVYLAVQGYLYEGMPISDVIKVLVPQNKGGNTPAIVGSVLDNYTNDLLDPNMRPEEAAVKAQQLYSDENFFKEILLKDPEGAFMKMTNPTLLANIPKDMKPLAYRWARKSAQHLLKPLAESLRNTQVNSDDVEVVYDKASGKFSLGGTALEQLGKLVWNPAVMPGDTAQELDYLKTAQKNIELFNRYSERYMEMAEAAGVKKEDAMALLFGDSDLENLKKEGGLFNQLSNKFFEFFRSEAQKMKNPTKSQGGGDTSPPPFVPGDRSIIKYRNEGAIRNLDLTNTLESKIASAVTDVFGEGYTVQVFSGGQPKKGSGGKRTGSIRHDEGKAADVYIVDPDGKRVTDPEVLDNLKNYWRQNKLGSIGTYMNGGGIHLDEWTEDQLLAGMGTSWSY